MNELKKNYEEVRKKVTITLSDNTKLENLEGVLFHKDNGSFLIEEKTFVRVVYPSHIKEVFYNNLDKSNLKRYFTQGTLNHWYETLKDYLNVQDVRFEVDYKDGFLDFTIYCDERKKVVIKSVEELERCADDLNDVTKIYHEPNFITAMINAFHNEQFKP